MLLTKEQILQSEDRESVDVEIKEWGGTVRLAVMSGTARDAYESSLIDLKEDGTATRNLENIRAKLVAASIVDEEGKTVFTADSIVALGNKNGAVLDRLYEVANQLNTVTQDKVEDLAKNS